jgi:hypothetical protein
MVDFEALLTNKLFYMARDAFHDLFREILTAYGWDITHDPYALSEWDPEWEIDFSAEKIIGAEKGNQKIAIELKSFLRPSFAYEFHQTLGQYINYYHALSEIEKDRILFLAVPSHIWETQFQRKGIQFSLEREQVKLIIYNIEAKTIDQWIRSPLK